MSVINRMLSELDSRHQPLPTAWAFEALLPPTLPPLRSRRRAGALALAGAVLIAAAAWTDWTMLLPEAAPGDLAATSPALTATQTAEEAPRPPPPAARPRPAARHDVASAEPATGAAPRTAPPRPQSAVQPQLAASHTDFAAAAAELLQQAPTSAGPLLASAAPSSIGPAPVQQPLPPAAPAAIEKRLVTPNPAQRAAQAYRQAVELAAAGHGTQAIERAQEALQADADHVPARQLAAALMFEKQRLPEALAVLNQGLERHPGQPQLIYLLARLKAESGDSAAALSLLAQSADVGADGHGLRAVLLARQGQFAAAARAYEAALRLANDNAAWWVGLGSALESDGQPAQARLAYQRARTAGTLNADLRAFVDSKLAAAN